MDLTPSRKQHLVLGGQIATFLAGHLYSLQPLSLTQSPLVAHPPCQPALGVYSARQSVLLYTATLNINTPPVRVDTKQHTAAQYFQ